MSSSSSYSTHVILSMNFTLLPSQVYKWARFFRNHSFMMFDIWRGSREVQMQWYSDKQWEPTKKLKFSAYIIYRPHSYCYAANLFFLSFLYRNHVNRKLDWLPKCLHEAICDGFHWHSFFSFLCHSIFWYVIFTHIFSSGFDIIIVTNI